MNRSTYHGLASVATLFLLITIVPRAAFKNLRWFIAVLVIVCISFFSIPPASAVQTNWKFPSDGNFGLAANWDNGVPDSAKVADFGLGFVGAASYRVTYNAVPFGISPPQFQANQLIVSGTNNVTFVKSFLPVGPSLAATSTDTTFANPGLIVGQNPLDNATLNDTILTSVTEAVVG